MDDNQTLKNYSDRILYGRSYLGYTPDFILLEQMWNKLSPITRKLLPSVRAKIWGLKTDALEKVSPPTKLSSSVKNTPENTRVYMDTADTGKVDSKGRKVFKDSKGRTHVKQGDKKVYVKKLFTPKRTSPSMASPVIRAASPVIRASSPMINTGKVDSKKRRVFKDSKGRTHVKQGDKKVYVKKLFTPKRTPPSVTSPVGK